MSTDIRCFIAIELDPIVRQHLAKIQNDLKKTNVDVKWVSPTNIHLTLKFLGEIPSGKVQAVSELLPSLVKGVSPFHVDLTHLGGFPDLKHPKVIWIGITQNEDKLATLAQKIENGLWSLGIAVEDRGFSAHITLGRVKSGDKLSSLCAVIEGYKIQEKIEQNIGEIILFKSTLYSAGPVYEKLLSVKLA